MATNLSTPYFSNGEPNMATGKMNSLEKLRLERRKLAGRQRRIIFNNDGDDIGGYDPPRNQDYPIDASVAGTAAGLLNVRTSGLLGSHVDAMFYYSTWGMKLHFQDSSPISGLIFSLALHLF